MPDNLVAALIVKDEEPCIRRCIDSVGSHVSMVIVSDTGSTDRTIQILQELGCSVIERPWTDFATNRNEILNNARAWGQYILCGIDADEELIVPEGFVWPKFSATGYYLEVHNDMLRYPRLAIISPSLGWQWKGVIHEALVHNGSTPYLETIDGPYILVHRDNLGARARDSSTMRKDLAVLQQAVHDEPENARYRFYLAQQHRFLGELKEARVEYRYRVTMQGWPPETAYAHYIIGVLNNSIGDMDPLSAWAQSFNIDRTRAEPLYQMARYHRSHGNDGMAAVLAEHAAHIPVSKQGLFVDADVYEWLALDEFVMAAFYVPHLKSFGKLAAEQLLLRKFPETERERIERNCSYYKE